MSLLPILNHVVSLSSIIQDIWAKKDNIDHLPEAEGISDLSLGKAIFFTTHTGFWKTQRFPFLYVNCILFSINAYIMAKTLFPNEISSLV